MSFDEVLNQHLYHTSARAVSSGAIISIDFFTKQAVLEMHDVLSADAQHLGLLVGAWKGRSSPGLGTLGTCR